jgi:hypothetical protein
MTIAIAICKRIDEIKKERCALVLNPASAGIRINDSASTWVSAKKPDTMRTIAQILDAELVMEEAALRRRAAQISLILGDDK